MIINYAKEPKKPLKITSIVATIAQALFFVAFAVTSLLLNLAEPIDTSNGFFYAVEQITNSFNKLKFPFSSSFVFLFD